MQISLQNLSDKIQTGWIKRIPLPNVIEAGEYDADGFRAYVTTGRQVIRDGHATHTMPANSIAYVRATLNPFETKKVTLTKSNRLTTAFILSDFISDEFNTLIPRFKVVTVDNNTYYSSIPYSFQLVEANDVLMVYKLSTKIVELPLNIVAYFYVKSEDDVIDFEIRLSYGSTAKSKNEPREVNLNSVSMICGEWPHIDYRNSVGLHTAMWRMDGSDVLWEQELVIPQTWLRARTYEIVGSLLCLPKNDKFCQNMDERKANIIARISGPLVGVALGWDGKFLSFGKVPNAEGVPWAQTEQDRRFQNFVASMFNYGGPMDELPYGRPPESGRTGEQADFGAVRGEHLRLDTEDPQPWALYDLRRSVQAWIRPPLANREEDTNPVTQEDHPDCITYNLLPYDRLSRDLLGWPKPTGWISGFGPPDSQHRSDNLLYVMWLLTRSYSILETILDMLELQKMELDRGMPSFGGGVGSPRGWGRPLLAFCHAYACGFTQVEGLIRKQISYILNALSYNLYPSGSLLNVASDNEGKYGWYEADGITPIRAWLGWQESILLMGLYAAYKQLGITEILPVIEKIGASIINYTFYYNNGKLYHAYGVKYDPNRPGMPPDGTYFTPTKPNFHVYTDGSCSRWSLTAVKIYLTEFPNGSEANRAREIIESYGSAKNWADVCWWEVS